MVQESSAPLGKEDGLVLVDYKTDHVKRGRNDRPVSEQMHYYSQALGTRVLKKVKECYLYSLRLEKRLLWRGNLRGSRFL